MPCNNNSESKNYAHKIEGKQQLQQQRFNLRVYFSVQHIPRYVHMNMCTRSQCVYVIHWQSLYAPSWVARHMLVCYCYATRKKRTCMKFYTYPSYIYTYTYYIYAQYDKNVYICSIYVLEARVCWYALLPQTTFLKVSN